MVNNEGPRQQRLLGFIACDFSLGLRLILAKGTLVNVMPAEAWKALPQRAVSSHESHHTVKKLGLKSSLDC